MCHLWDFISHTRYCLEAVHERRFRWPSQSSLLVALPLFSSDKDFYLADGVHLNSVGQYQLYRSYRGAILRAIRMLWIFVTILRLNVCVHRLFVIFLLMDTFSFLFMRGFTSAFWLPVLLRGHFVFCLLRWVSTCKVLPCASLVSSELVCSAIFVGEFTVNPLSLGSLCCFFNLLGQFFGACWCVDFLSDMAWPSLFVLF